MVKLIDVVLEGTKSVVRWLTDLFMDGLRSGYRSFRVEWFRTPTPHTEGPFVFGTPTNAPWPALRETLIGGEIMLIALLVLVIAVQGRHVIRIFNVGSGYHARRTAKTAWMGAVLIITWYWIAVTTLSLVDGLTIVLMPDVSTLTNLLEGFAMTRPSNTGLALGLALLGGVSMWVLEALLYIREVLLYVYLYGMPIAIALEYSNIPIVSRIASRLCYQFIPLALLPLPAALLFKGYDLLYVNGASLAPNTAFLQTIVAVSMPLIALYLTWKTFGYAAPATAGAIGTATSGTVLLGGVVAGSYFGGTKVATTAARWGPKAATSHAVAKRAAPGSYSQVYEQSTEDRSTSDETSTSDTTDTDEKYHSHPTYRRTENDPGIY